MARLSLALVALTLFGTQAPARADGRPPGLSISVQPDPSRGRSVRVTVTNPSPRKLTATVKVEMIGNRTDTISDITVGPRESTSLTISNAQPASMPFARPLAIDATVTAGSASASWAGNVHFWSAGRAEYGPALVLDSAQQWQTQSGAWSGPEDLSARITARYDSQRLYLRAEVTDDVFCQMRTLAGIGDGDSLKIAIDPSWAREPGSAGVVEIGLALTPMGPQVYRWSHPAGVMPGAALVATRSHTGITYNVALPWTALGVQAVAAPRTIGLSILVNDNDGQGRKGGLTYGDGITEPTRADRFATLTLLP